MTAPFLTSSRGLCIPAPCCLVSRCSRLAKLTESQASRRPCPMIPRALVSVPLIPLSLRRRRGTSGCAWRLAHVHGSKASPPGEHQYMLPARRHGLSVRSPPALLMMRSKSPPYAAKKSLPVGTGAVEAQHGCLVEAVGFNSSPNPSPNSGTARMTRMKYGQPPFVICRSAFFALTTVTDLATSVNLFDSKDMSATVDVCHTKFWTMNLRDLSMSTLRPPGGIGRNH